MTDRSSAADRRAASPNDIFDVGINERLSPGQLLVLGLQNVFGMTGMFVFPGILGRSFHLSPEQIAYLYGVSFATCGIITILQSVWLLRLPVIQGPYAGSFAALLAVGHLQAGGLGAAYGSLAVASAIWCLLTIPVRGFSCVGFFARFLRAPIISGIIVMLTIIQVADVALPSWIGLPASPGYPLVNISAGLVAVVVIVAVTLWGGSRFRRGAIVQADLVAVFLLVLIAAGMGSMAMYQMVADWGPEDLPAERASQGVFAVGLGSILVGIIGGFSTIVYPDNIGMMRATRVGSRYATAAAGVLLIVLGGSVKFDMLLVIVPIPVLSASATLLFGIVFMQGVQILAHVEWDDRIFIVAGLAILVGLGGLFVSPQVLKTMPLAVKLLVQQPVISGGLVLVILHALLVRTPPAPVAAAPEKNAADRRQKRLT